ncbi:MAG TPA: ATP-binding cassette domain-containing protein [Bacteroidota bacterium]|nr:ATP-binding cassette domain-containing protein [Bacteroidota bacterium]
MNGKTIPNLRSQTSTRASNSSTLDSLEEAILETFQLTRRYGALTAVNAVSFAVNPGEIFGIIGPNGAGKTTTIKMLTTLLPPTSGRALVAKFDISRQARDVRRSIGYVPQLVSADGNLTGYENLLLFAKLYDIPSNKRLDRIQRALELMELSDARNNLVKTYSGGMIRRLEIAQAVLHRPHILFLDEPTVGLDPVARQSVWAQVKMLVDRGTTVILTTHYMEEAESLCSRVAIMHKGSIVANGTPEELKKTVGGKKTTLDDVFAFYSGNALESGGNYRETSRVRRTARRLG